MFAHSYNPDDMTNEEDLDEASFGIALPFKTKKKSNDEDWDDDKDEKPLESMNDVSKVVKSMIFYASKAWIMKKMIRKLEMTTDVQVLRKFLLSHGLVCLKTILNIYLKTDIVMCSQVSLYI